MIWKARSKRLRKDLARIIAMEANKDAGNWAIVCHLIAFSMAVDLL
jgi:hypothetical protein